MTESVLVVACWQQSGSVDWKETQDNLGDDREVYIIFGVKVTRLTHVSENIQFYLQNICLPSLNFN